VSEIVEIVGRSWTPTDIGEMVEIVDTHRHRGDGGVREGRSWTPTDIGEMAEFAGDRGEIVDTHRHRGGRSWSPTDIGEMAEFARSQTRTGIVGDRRHSLTSG